MKDQVIDIETLQQDDHNFNKGTCEGHRIMAKSFAEYGAGRSILVDKDGRIIAGNKSQRAAIEAGIKKVRVIETDGTELIAVKRTDLSLDSKKGRGMAMMDNVTAIKDISWDNAEIERVDAEVGLDLSMVDFCSKSISPMEVEDMSEEQKISRSIESTASKNMKETAKKKAAWGKGKNYKEPVCDLQDRLFIHQRKEYMYISIFRTSDEGIPISEIKVEDNVRLFALKAEEMVRGVVGLKQTEDWCVITTPKRRHTTKNFATMVCEVLAKRLGVPFYEDAIVAKNRDRLKPHFELVEDIKENNVILYDDIITTGSTLLGCNALLVNKNVLNIIGIANNK